MKGRTLENVSGALYAGLGFAILYLPVKADEIRPYTIIGEELNTNRATEISYPFRTDGASGIQNYFNKRSWKDGRFRNFISVRNCGFTSKDYGGFSEGYAGPLYSSNAAYACNADYTENSHLGERMCLGGLIGYEGRWYDKNGYKQGGFHYFTPGKECGKWKGKNQSTPTRQTEISTVTNIVWKNRLILAGGAGIFVAGGLLGVVCSRFLRRNKD